MILISLYLTQLLINLKETKGRSNIIHLVRARWHRIDDCLSVIPGSRLLARMCMATAMVWNLRYINSPTKEFWSFSLAACAWLLAWRTLMFCTCLHGIQPCGPHTQCTNGLQLVWCCARLSFIMAWKLCTGFDLSSAESPGAPFPGLI